MSNILILHKLQKKFKTIYLINYEYIQMHC